MNSTELLTGLRDKEFKKLIKKLRKEEKEELKMERKELRKKYYELKRKEKELFKMFMKEKDYKEASIVLDEIKETVKAKNRIREILKTNRA